MPTKKSCTVTVVYTNGKPKKKRKKPLSKLVRDFLHRSSKKEKVHKIWNWYALSVEYKREGTVRRALRRRAIAEDLEGWLGRILNPKEKIETVKETEKGTKRVTSSKNQLPGYILVEIASTTRQRDLPPARSRKGTYMKGGDRKLITHYFNNDLLTLIKDTKYVIGLLPDHYYPTPCKQEEADRFDRLTLNDESVFGEPKVKEVKLPYKEGDKVVILKGAFRGQEGPIHEITGPKHSPKVKVMATLWGVDVPVEVIYNEVKRIQ